MSNILPEDHDHDEDGNCIVPQGLMTLPEWRWSAWDVVGITATTVGGLFSVIGQGLNLIARECGAMANWSRSNRDIQAAQRAQEEARWEMSAAYKELVFGDAVSEDES